MKKFERLEYFCNLAFATVSYQYFLDISQVEKINLAEQIEWKRPKIFEECLILYDQIMTNKNEM